MNRRKFFWGAGLSAASLSAASLGLQACQPATPSLLDLKSLSEDEAFKAYIKTIGSLETSDVYIWFRGILWGAIPGQLPFRLCGFQGLARHRWTAESSTKFRQKSFDVGFFSDIETGQPIDSLMNPITQERVETFHFKYGGFEQTHDLAEFAEKSAKLDWRAAGNHAVLTETGIGQVESKFTPQDWPKETSGPINFYGGETSHVVSLKTLSDPNIPSVKYDMFWSQFAPWEPWLLMEGRPGFCQWRATGTKLDSHSDAPKEVLDFVTKHQPNYFDETDPWDGYVSNTNRYQQSRSPKR